jgi:hypothetical protein
MSQVVEHLFSKCKALSLISNTENKKRGYAESIGPSVLSNFSRGLSDNLCNPMYDWMLDTML